MELLEGETPISINLHQILVDGKPKYSSNLQGYNQINKNEVTFWHKGFQVQYVNTNDGLRQNFILPENPGGNTLNIQLSVSGANPQLANANKVGLFRNGEEVLQYADLKVWDATGAALPGEMKVVNGRIQLEVTGLESAIYPLVIDPLSSTPASVLESNQANASFGYSVSSAGDVNGDGYSDVIVGAYYYTNGQSNEGAAYVYLGSATGLSSTPANIFESNQAGAYFGYAVSSAGDVNGDGYSDVIVGAYYYDNGQSDEGAVYVYLGSATGLSSTPANIFESNQAGAYFGNSVSTAGDVNGDGYSDVIVGAYYYTNGQSDEGAAHVYLGSSTGLSSTPANILESNQAGAYFGYAVSSAGDVNGDGYSDVIVGAYRYDNGQSEEGAAYVYLGSATGLSSTPANIFESNQVSARFGSSVSSAGDVNGDGYSDVIVGANQYTNGQSNEGAAYVYLGSSTGLSSTPANIFESNQAGAFFGNFVSSAGDVNGDGYSDVIVGAYAYDNGQSNEGRAYVYLGSSTGLSSTPANIFESNQVSANFGNSVSSAGDVNGDGYSDVIVGANRYDNGQSDEGAAFVYFGGASELSSTPVGQWTLNQAYANFGYSVSSAGDVNGDGYEDVIVGANYYDNGQNLEGAAFVYLGSATGLSSTPANIFESNQASAFFGNSVSSAGDVNGDGYSDVIVGAYQYTNGQTDEGAAFVYLGSASGLSAVPSDTLELNLEYSEFGFSVSSAGDVNGDGYSDVIVGAPYPNSAAITNDGAFFVFLGSASGLSRTPANMKSSQLGSELGQSVASAPMNMFVSFQPLPNNFNIGYSVSSAGDVNGDGYSDVIVGAAYYSNGQTEEGAAYVYLGSSTGLSSTPANILESNQANANFGWSVSSAGDVNGDGYSDVIVGAYRYDNGQSEEGAAYVYLGSATGLSSTPANIFESNQVSARFGSSVSSAGDINGDGYSDVIVGAYYYDNGQSDEGAAYVYLGSATGLSSTPANIFESNQTYANFGTSVSSAGDVNGDGYSDVIVGANNQQSSSQGGAGYVYLGNENGGLRSNVVTYDQNQTSKWTISSIGDNSFTVGLFNKSPNGRVNGAIQVETVGEGQAFGTGTVTTGSFSDLGTAGKEQKLTVNYEPGVRTRYRVRQVFDKQTSIDGRIYGPWRNGSLEGLIGGDAVLYDGAWHKGSGVSGAPTTADNSKRLLIHGSGALISVQATVQDLIISAGSDLTIQAGQCLTVQGEAGNEGTLTIGSDANAKHGNYIGPSLANVEVELSITDEGWHNLSVPVSITLREWAKQNTDGSIDTSGQSNRQNVWKYNTTLSNGANGGYANGSYSSHSWGTWEMFGKDDTLVGKGLNVYIDGNYNGAPQVLKAVGTTIDEDVDIPLYNSYGGWSLVGNPYPGSLNLNQLYTENSSAMNPGVYIWNEASSNLIAVDAQTGLAINGSLGTNANGVAVSMGQSFYMRPSDFNNNTASQGSSNNSFSQTLTLSQTQMVCGSNYLWKSSYPVIRLISEFSGSTSKDEVALVFDPTFTDGYQKSEDIEKYFAVQGDVPGLFIADDDNAMSIAKWSTPVDKDTIPMGLTTAHDGSMKIHMVESPSHWNVYLKDLKTQTVTYLNGGDYNFQQDTAYGPDRFELIVALSSVSAEEHNRMLSSDPFAYKANDETMIIDFGSFAGSNVSLQLYNLNGQRVWACNEPGVDRKRYVQDLQPGAYILMMQTSEGRVYQQKMIW
ncbi:hypothetical protein GCM10011318_11070 [Phaeocystidibacter marisrubri]|nr:hypothetical protein GCM10011318_11070 [Phaeocystidibacter marisrubri]